MTQVMKRYGKGVVLKPETADVTENAEGSLWSNSTEQRMKTYIEGAVRQLVTNNQTQTLENKTIVAANNTITTAASGNLTATELNAALAELQGDIDTNASGLSNHLSDTSDAHDASAISVVPTGNLAASDVQAALVELQGDADSSATHISASTDVHGLTGGAAVVGTTSAQTLTNKTIPGASIQTPSRLDVKQDTKANLVTYATTATNGQLVFATDTKELLQVLDGVLSAVGGGGIGGVDILFVQDFESAALSDFTQTGLSLSTSSPLHGDVSALLTHQNAVSQPFKQVIAVDRKFRGEAMTMRLNVKSNASAGNVTLNIYDETNAANLVASEQLQLANDTSGALNKIGFTIPETCASLSYTITALPEAGSPVTRVDDIIAELAVTSLLETSVEVPVITEWQGYTPAFQGFGTPTAVEFEWRQVGQDIEIRGKFTSGTPTAVEARIGLPGGLTSAGTALIPSIQNCGLGSRGGNGVAGTYQILIEPSVSYVTVGLGSSTTNGFTKVNGSNLANAAESFGFFAKVPCAGLSATTTKTIDLTQSGLVQNPDSVLRAVGSTGQSITALVTNIPFSTVQLTIGSDVQFNGSSFTVLTSGIYTLDGAIDFTTSLSRSVELYVDGSSYRRISDITTANDKQFFSYSDYFTAGSVISIRVGTNGGTLENSASNTSHFITITKQSSLKQVTVSSDQKIKIPTSELRMSGLAGKGAVATRIVRFNTVDKLRGDAFTVTSNANDATFVTMTKSGILEVSASVRGTSTGALSITLNQSNVTLDPADSEVLINQALTATNTDFSAAATVSVKAGDIIRVTTNTTIGTSTAGILSLNFQEQDIAVSVTNTLPQFSESDSTVSVRGSNGYGSTANKIRRFSSVVTNLGTDVEYADSATNGASFTIKSSGIYNIVYVEDMNVGGDYFGVTKNSAQLTTSIAAASIAGANTDELLTLARVAVSTALESCSWTGYLQAGDVIRPHTTGGAASDADSARFTITKVGKPNVTGVDVTPFVKIPQNDVQVVRTNGQITTALLDSSGEIRFNSSIFSNNTNNGIISIEDDVTNTRTKFTALKRCVVQFTMTAGSTTANNAIALFKNGALYSDGGAAAANTFLLNSSTIQLEANEFLSVVLSNMNVGAGYNIHLVATAASDSIITATESFSTDTASLTYAPSSLYTLSTLSNAPVGTFITYTKAGGSNTLTQTTVAPTQTTSDMNTNGILSMLGITANATTAAAPGAFAMQIGKGLKGVTANVYRLSGKTTAGTVFGSNSEGGGASGIPFTYNERTGILFLTTCTSSVSTVTSWGISFEDNTSAVNGTQVYVTFNASKSPALAGVPLLQPRIATISYEVASGTAGGGITAGAYQTRPLNTLVDPTGIVTSLASNQVSLSAGEYYIDALAAAHDCNTHKLKLRNITDSTDSIIGMYAASGTTDGSVRFPASLKGRVVITSQKTFELQHRSTATRAADGLGQAASFGDNEVHTILKITRIK